MKSSRVLCGSGVGQLIGWKWGISRYEVNLTCVKAHYNRDAQELLCSSHLNHASSCSNVALLLGSITPIVASTALTKKILSNFVFISKFSWYFELQLTSNMEIKIDKMQPIETRPGPSHWQFLEGLDVPSKTQKAFSGHFICIPKIVASEYETP